MVRELVSYQRHTVWLDIIQNQRQIQNATILKTTSPPTTDLSMKNFITIIIQNYSAVAFVSCTIIFALLLCWKPSSNHNIHENDDTVEAQHNAFALLVYVSLLWATEAVPLFVSALICPFLTVVLRVIIDQDNNQRLNATDCSKHTFNAMFSHVIMLLLGGFSIAAALSKHNIAQSLSSAITKTRLVGNNTRRVLAAYLFLATFTSMWISNVAAPTLCYSLIQPILKATTASTSRIQYGSQQAKHAETDRRLSKALVLGIALASNVGGLASPISSPQNLFAIEYSIGLGWIQWFSVSIPLCIILDT